LGCVRAEIAEIKHVLHERYIFQGYFYLSLDFLKGRCGRGPLL